MEARQYLRDLMQSFVESFEAAGAPDPAAARHRLTGAARALVWAGELDAPEPHDVLREFDDLLESRGLLRRTVRHTEASESAPMVRVTDAPRSPNQRRNPPAELRSVVPVNERFVELDGYVMTAVSLEVWSHHLSFRYAVQGEVRALLGPPGRWSDWRWEASDDLGQVYELIGSSGGSGGPGQLTGSVDFGGSPGAGARRIAVRLHHGGGGPTSMLIDLPADER